MNRQFLSSAVVTVLLLSAPGVPLTARHTAAHCKAIHADLVESRSTTVCKPSDPVCFVGEVDGNHGLRGTTYFRGDSRTDPIPTSPQFIGYSGVFEYTTDHGTLIARESGVTSPAQGVVTAHQRITDATGDYAGATGYFFVSGSNDGQNVVTTVVGQICYP